MSRRSTDKVVIDIEGVIGTPESWQFETEDERVATYEKFRQTLGSIREIEAQSVQVNIRSRGGSVEDALLIYEALTSLSARVETICHGYVASAATVIAQAGDVRKISSDTLYLVHRATMTVDGNSAEIMQASSLLNKTDERIAQLYASRSGRVVEEFRELMSRDAGRGEWLSPEEVVAAGLADEVVDISYLSRMGKKLRDMILPRSPIGRHVGIDGHSQVPRNETVTTLSKAQLAATATVTLPKEDVFVTAADINMSSQNQRAYNEDVEVFRSTIV